jgi:hypothetical protein
MNKGFWWGKLLEDEAECFEMEGICPDITFA